MNFDEPINRIGTHSVKWDGMEAAYGVSPQGGLPMWVADMDFRPPACVQRALEAMAAHGVYGYFGDDAAYLEAIRWWMQTRHDWTVKTGDIFTTHGLVNGTALCIEAFTQQGDGVVLMTPVYHAFARVIRAAGRQVVECPLVGQEMDFAAWDGLMTGREKMLILCSPHNPGGRVWTEAELRGVVAFCDRHGLVLVSDEIHHDLVMPGSRHLPMTRFTDRVVMMTATTKTFNIAGAHIGNVIISDPDLKARFAAVVMKMGISPNAFGMHMARAAYSPEGAAWVDALVLYLQENARIFDAAIHAIPGLRSVPLQATYLAWVDFAGTGMAPQEIQARIERGARIAANHGASFGSGGESCMRFNLAMPRAQIQEAAARMQAAFADLQ